MVSLKPARTYPELNIKANVPIYEQYENNPKPFGFVANLELVKHVWKDFVP